MREDIKRQFSRELKKSLKFLELRYGFQISNEGSCFVEYRSPKYFLRFFFSPGFCWLSGELTINLGNLKASPYFPYAYHLADVLRFLNLDQEQFKKILIRNLNDLHKTIQQLSDFFEANGSIIFSTENDIFERMQQYDNAQRHNIIKVRQSVDKSLPKTIEKLGVGRILNRRIISWSNRIGSYGMGGYGFFGLEMAPEKSRPKEWLILTIFGASEWLLLDGAWMEANPNQHHMQRPLYIIHQFLPGDKLPGIKIEDRVSDCLVGAIIEDAVITKKESKIFLKKDSNKHLLELPEDTSRLPLWGGSLKIKKWNLKESHLDAWIVSESSDLIP